MDGFLCSGLHDHRGFPCSHILPEPPPSPHLPTLERQANQFQGPSRCGMLVDLFCKPTVSFLLASAGFFLLAQVLQSVRAYPAVFVLRLRRGLAHAPPVSVSIFLRCTRRDPCLCFLFVVAVGVVLYRFLNFGGGGGEEGGGRGAGRGIRGTVAGPAASERDTERVHGTYVCEMCVSLACRHTTLAGGCVFVLAPSLFCSG